MAAAHRPQQHLDWDEQFTRVSDQDAKGKGKARIVEVDGDLDKAFQQLSTEDKTKEASQPDYMAEFQKYVKRCIGVVALSLLGDFRTWAKSNVEGQDPSALSKWEAEVQQILQAQREEGEQFGEQDLNHDYGATMKEAWETRYGAELDPDFAEKQMRLHFDDDGFPILPEYKFGGSPMFLFLESVTKFASAIRTEQPECCDPWARVACQSEGVLGEQWFLVRSGFDARSCNPEGRTWRRWL